MSGLLKFLLVIMISRCINKAGFADTVSNTPVYSDLVLVKPCSGNYLIKKKNKTKNTFDCPSSDKKPFDNAFGINIKLYKTDSNANNIHPQQYKEIFFGRDTIDFHPVEKMTPAFILKNYLIAH